MIYLHKLLPLIASPLGLVVMLGLTGLLLKRRWLGFLSLALLIAFSLPLTATAVWKGLEADFPFREVADLEGQDAVVVLSGIVGARPVDGKLLTDWGDPDRFFTGLQILEERKAGVLILTQGKVPWAQGPTEGVILRDQAIRMGVSPDKILLTAEAANTFEEAQAVKALMDERKLESVVLVTSSFHMPRAKRIFDSVGIVSEPYPTDFKTLGAELNWLSFVPSAGAFSRTSSGLREYIGRIYYALRS